MKFSVVFLQYTSNIALQKAVDSLFPIHEYVEKTIVIPNRHSIGTLPAFKNDLQYESETDLTDVGTILNAIIPTLKSEYVLFMFDHDLLTQNCRDMIPFLKINTPVLIFCNGSSEETYARPFLVKTNYLQKGPPFFTKPQVPFSEAVVPAWLSQIPAEDVSFIGKQIANRLYKKQRKWEQVVAELTRMYRPRSLNQSKESNRPSLTVLIATHNMAQFVKTALASLITQIERADQILVIDDGSTDDTQQVLKDWASLDSIHVLQSDNGGKARALNVLLPLVTSEFVIELDADDWLDPHALSTIRKKLHDLPDDVLMLYGNLRKWKVRSTGELWFNGIQQGKPVHHPSELTSYPLPLAPRVYRTNALKRVGGFPVLPFADGRLYEDVLVIRSLLQIGRIEYQDFTVYNIREHQQSITKRNWGKWAEFCQQYHAQETLEAGD